MYSSEGRIGGVGCRVVGEGLVELDVQYWEKDWWSWMYSTGRRIGGAGCTAVGGRIGGAGCMAVEKELLELNVCQ